MLSITDEAYAHLARLLDDVRATDGMAVRFSLEEDDLWMQPGGPMPGDTTFAHAGRTLLVLSEQVATALSGKTLDVVTDEDGPALAVIPAEDAV
jgi:Fe-S cluster assembly iron-binding protein IscA